ncbi:UNVERIFIED_CONTAM: Omega-hydroxypalmitate O-feruloyl transferase [Sesamum latifolium]|uniref:Omega-hydroxypalmitate O-feruloyl transferase n=1 Tax=Sesamum latifolium TaxID=2727402 RepID=A0AAW2Y0U2_9LAMI
MAQWVQELHFPQLDIPITIDKVEPILSNSNIPANNKDSLYLSNLDDMVGVRVFTPTVYFYQSKGALLVEAHSDVALADLGDLSVPNPAWIKLIYRFPNEEEYKVVDMPLVIAQVTKFSCGGFSLGLRICHCLCDGLGAMQFLSAWAGTAKAGSLVVNPKPCWDREIFLPRDPPKIAFSHTEFKRIDEGSTLTMNLWQGKPVQKCYRISQEFQARLKRAVQADGKFSCTTFDALAAHVWRSWVKALDVKPLDYELRLTFSVNARAKLKNPRLNDGFYGNALCVACTTSTVSRLVDGCLAETARLVHEARLGVSEDYLRSTIDYIDLHRPKRLEFGGKLTTHNGLGSRYTNRLILVGGSRYTPAPST